MHYYESIAPLTKLIRGWMHTICKYEVRRLGHMLVYFALLVSEFILPSDRWPQVTPGQWSYSVLRFTCNNVCSYACMNDLAKGDIDIKNASYCGACKWQLCWALPRDVRHGAWFTSICTYTEHAYKCTYIHTCIREYNIICMWHVYTH